MANDKESQAIAVVMVPMPAQGHLNQLLHLSHRLASTAIVPVYYIGAATHIRQAKLRLHGWDLSSISNNINFHEFPTPHFQNPQPDPHAPTNFPVQIIPSILTTINNLRGPVFAFVNDLSIKYKKVVIIYDSLMASVVQDIYSIPNAESYRFWSLSAITLYFLHWHTAGRPDNLPAEAYSILKELPAPDGLFHPEVQTLRASRKNRISGVIYNSSVLIEGLYLDLLANGTAKQWAIGPFNPIKINTYPEKKNDSSRIIRHECLDWLDKQGPNSVIFVSFGTTTSISDEQIKELAIGLEKSQQKFIWVLREADKGDIFSGETRKPVLPDGFEGRVKKRGIVVRDWAPQLEVLGHSATGGFMSHCGWNSCMESISMGVPIATWPMHSDQPVNAALVTKGLRIGVEVKDWACGDEVVSSGVVESAVRKLMGSEEGDEMRKRAKELGDAVKQSVMDGGISRKEMDSFITHITVKSKL
ncbi:zeatin o-glucosyltransferase [Phtheirospermum japonicum]|uniref:Glycosyltransferase n=1 Tax=Phtheirospermum japonicum TaxID=374723 RepID=A0A830BK07_9LAMI|nr:zeatin o-glucosyltransferase [Phtheirospermum japonicum]